MRVDNPTHTAGPWTCTHLGTGYGLPRNIHSAANGRAIAHMCGDSGGPAEWDANARLVCAAPELLSACLDVISDLKLFVSRQGPGPDRRLAALSAAIKKAVE